MRIRRTLVVPTALAIGLTVHLAAGSAVSAQADSVCTAMDDAVYQRLRPDTGAQLSTPWRTEIDASVARGFTVDLGTSFRASTRAAEGLVPVDRLYRSISGDFAYITNPLEVAAAVANLGYADQGSYYYASPRPLPCTVPVLRFQRGGVHRLAMAQQRAELEAEGWRYEMEAFHAVPAAAPVPPPPTTTAPPTTAPPTTAPPTTAPPTTAPPTTAPATTVAPQPVDATFSFAVIPDTQNETYSGDVRMPERVEWLLANRVPLDLRWVLHSGDVHNWDTPDHSQFAAMSTWLRPLAPGGLPLVAAVGNHDTAAVCPGGSACPGVNANVAIRDTSTWNAYYPPSAFGFQGLFEPGKSDNGWRTFSAGGKDWLVLSLELYPRTAVIDWAERVVTDHPEHNVIVVTHAFLNGDGSVGTSNGGYGANSPATLWNALDDHPNVVMTFSGHVGQAATTTLRGPDGHATAAFLQTFHDATYNPTRIVTVNTATGTVSTEIVANWNRLTRLNVDVEYTEHRATVTGLDFVG